MSDDSMVETVEARRRPGAWGSMIEATTDTTLFAFSDQVAQEELDFYREMRGVG